VLSVGYNCYRGIATMNIGATIHAEHLAINKLKPRPRNKKLYKINLVVIKVSNTGLIGMSKPCKHCVDNLQILANRKGYTIDCIYFSNQLREIEKWSYNELELDPNKHVTEFYKEKDKKCSHVN
jgi:cytidine deaminase